MRKIGTLILTWIGIRWFALRHAREIEQHLIDSELKDERIQLLLQQIAARDTAIKIRDDSLSFSVKRIDELGKALDEANEFRHAAAVEFDALRGEVQRLVAQLHELETKGDTEYAVLPVATTNGKRTRKKGGAQ